MCLTIVLFSFYLQCDLYKLLKPIYQHHNLTNHMYLIIISLSVRKSVQILLINRWTYTDETLQLQYIPEDIHKGW